ncbi:hypothetical protein [Rhodopila sp.]|uniref:hypothetical protein n=1 Tax=Rhodopila sp. TaxID=2480087 RepID=UPI003D0A2407
MPWRAKKPLLAQRTELAIARSGLIEQRFEIEALKARLSKLLRPDGSVIPDLRPVRANIPWLVASQNSRTI